MNANDPKSYNRPDRTTLHEGDVGQIGAALIALTREIWVLTDRMAVLETVLARHGLDVAEEIDSFQPDAAMRKALDARGERLVASVVGTLAMIQTD